MVGKRQNQPLRAVDDPTVSSWLVARFPAPLRTGLRPDRGAGNGASSHHLPVVGKRQNQPLGRVAT
ncbi:hypothetical protein Sm713_02920 [Streptomyces sp. TS71-3]|nr:hypothetical protein Sm713_02920 [Streptomyces sp. TS71-3]